MQATCKLDPSYKFGSEPEGSASATLIKKTAYLLALPDSEPVLLLAREPPGRSAGTGNTFYQNKDDNQAQFSDAATQMGRPGAAKKGNRLGNTFNQVQVVINKKCNSMEVNYITVSKALTVEKVI